VRALDRRPAGRLRALPGTRWPPGSPPARGYWISPAGRGYGTALLAVGARDVVGVDIDSRTVEHASANYRGNNLHFMPSGCLRLWPPLRWWCSSPPW
jgi:hypothetical protein